MMAQEQPYRPPLGERISTAASVGVVGFLCRTFLFALNRTEVHGLDRLLEVVDSREDEKGRMKGLITVSNHVSVLDDPLIWGVLPYSYHWNPNNIRWGLGSYDICFKNRFTSAFFTYGNTLPTHRSAHSKYGGLFQPTMTQAIRLLSDPHAGKTSSEQTRIEKLDFPNSLPASDPFSSSEFTYSTNGMDSFPAPAAYPSRRFSWVHIFPEGMIHQHPDKVMRYFKWGVARLILESEPCPDVLPMWIDGPQEVMNEDRTWPRPMPRAGKDITICIGELVDTEKVFEPYRERWRSLKEKQRRRKRSFWSKTAPTDSEGVEELGVLTDDELRYGKEAEKLRIDVTMAVRNEVLKVRRSHGLKDEDPKRGLAETWAAEGGKGTPREGEKNDGSIVRELS
ncbi:Hypothetical protein R9X50_00179600 [Acrodontium crateriforme]|uniref:Tafazzin family protein n=1 Tax=Acrodontium crateriforme TaxID=150365 RepID=A0AAQ3R8H3_9PEZI|nr:Hypothetical protein R9X50_00179600 [Acrodontium crateriforme]